MTLTDFSYMPRRSFLARSGALAASGLLVSPALFAQKPATPGGAYEPTRGQFGKDVIWIPSPDTLVTRMLRLANTTPQDYVIDLGSGDGKIVIAAAREFNAQGKGIEYNPDLVELSNRRAQASGVGKRAEFEKADIFESDFSRATVITMYLLPHLNLKLRPRIMALKPGTRVVSHAFNMGRWVPDETSRVGTASVYLWLVPANVGGDWELSFPQQGGPADVKLSLAQTFQNFTGEARFKDFSTSVRNQKVAGDRVTFSLTDEDGHLRRFEGQVSGDRINGSVFEDNKRAPFTARRVGAAPAIGGSGPAPENEADSLYSE
ncbi:class I SAM-dependent methyltransferase [Ottowia thiooxydans]|uniref:class I SAM-dependent methyltransferase n=1 Tax=Ottowia thiooxydans TaxID=219182 RepID=UPI0004109E7E|nr:methyltransferase domain-containing protein [Ottowia thiooxydans]